MNCQSLPAEGRNSVERVSVASRFRRKFSVAKADADGDPFACLYPELLRERLFQAAKFADDAGIDAIAHGGKGNGIDEAAVIEPVAGPGISADQAQDTDGRLEEPKAASARHADIRRGSGRRGLRLGGRARFMGDSCVHHIRQSVTGADDNSPGLSIPFARGFHGIPKNALDYGPVRRAQFECARGPARPHRIQNMHAARSLGPEVRDYPPDFIETMENFYV